MKWGVVHLICVATGGLLLFGCGSSEDAKGAGPGVKVVERTPPAEQKEIALHYKKTFGARGDIKDGDVVRIHFNDKTITPTALENIKKLTELRVLTLTACRITDEGLKHVGGLSKLEVLKLDQNKNVTDAGLAHVLQMQKLHTLNVSNTKLTDSGLLKFDALKSLKNLNIRSTRVSPQGLEKFEKQSSVAKNCVIESDY